MLIKHIFLVMFFILIVSISNTNISVAQNFNINAHHSTAIGTYVTAIKDPKASFSANAVLSKFHQGLGEKQNVNYLNFGINSDPIWLILPIENNQITSTYKRLSIETPWLDSIDIYLFSQNRKVFETTLGDTNTATSKPVRGRYFDVDIEFPPDESYLVIRVATPDPLIVPLYIRNISEQQLALNNETFRYGIVYGAIAALLLYNFIIGFRLNSRVNLFYSFYMCAFLCMNISYTGHGFLWLWPNSPVFQNWSIPIFMMAYVILGLIFTANFFSLKQNIPKLYNLIKLLISIIILSITLTIILNSQVAIILLAFFYGLVLLLLITFIGVIAWKKKLPSANYFLVAACAGLSGAIITHLTVWGITEYNAYAFMAIEFGMMLEAILLSLALADKFNRIEIEKNSALLLANIDPLTELNNRRAFYQYSEHLMQHALDDHFEVAVIMLDLDDFKNLNDTYGHKAGDIVLKQVANILTNIVREQDVLSRWGGEEFIVLLPKTNLSDTLVIAERIRLAVSKKKIDLENQTITITTSIGVACSDVKREDNFGLADIIKAADEQLYLAKNNGKNRVAFS